MTFQRSATRTARKGRDPVPVGRDGTRGSTSWRASPSSPSSSSTSCGSERSGHSTASPRSSGFCCRARPEFFVRLFSGGNSRPGKSGVHYTQLDARVAPRYVRQTALLLTSPYYIASHRFPSCFLSSSLPRYAAYPALVSPR